MGLGVLGDGVGQDGQGDLGDVASVLAAPEFASRLEGRGGQEGFQHPPDGLGRRVSSFWPLAPATTLYTLSNGIPESVPGAAI